MINTKCLDDILAFAREKGYTIDEIAITVSHIQYIQNQANVIKIDYSEKLKEALRESKKDAKKIGYIKAPLVHKSISPIVSKVVLDD